MNRPIIAAQPWLRGLLLVTLTLGCAPAPREPVVTPERDGTSEGRSASFDALPARAASRLPAGTFYRVALDSSGTVALALLGIDQRLLGRLTITPGAGPHASPGVRVEVEDLGGQSLLIEAWSSAGALHGRAFVGGRSVAWRARLEADGALTPERWSPAHRGAIEELVALHRARTLAADLRELTPASSSRVLAEGLALAELALELSVRAWTGHDRAHLPKVTDSATGC